MPRVWTELQFLIVLLIRFMFQGSGLRKKRCRAEIPAVKIQELQKLAAQYICVIRHIMVLILRLWPKPISVRKISKKGIGIGASPFWSRPTGWMIKTAASIRKKLTANTSSFTE